MWQNLFPNNRLQLIGSGQRCIIYCRAANTAQRALRQQIDQQMTTKPSGTGRPRLTLRSTTDAATSPPQTHFPISLTAPSFNKPATIFLPPPRYFLPLSRPQTISEESEVIGINFGVREKSSRCFKSEIWWEAGSRGQIKRSLAWLNLNGWLGCDSETGWAKSTS